MFNYPEGYVAATRNSATEQALKNAHIIQSYYANAAVSATVYATWEDSFRIEDLKRNVTTVKSGFPSIDFTAFGLSELLSLGFRPWDDSGLLLIPLWAYDHIAAGQTLVTISGKIVVVGENYKASASEGYVDNDHRGGALAYGVFPNQNGK